MSFFLPLTLLLTAFSSLLAQSIIPKPQMHTWQRGHCILKGRIHVVYDRADSLLIQPALQSFCTTLSHKLHCIHKPGEKINPDALPSPIPYLIFEKTKKDFFRAEGYQLSIQPKLIRIEASDASGFFYAIQTLLQLFPVEFVDASFPEHVIAELPCLEIEDYPRFPHRGMHLDVARHFFPVSDIKKYLDLMAMYKMNHFYWHLSDDQGWRIEIKKYPKLTEVGSKRKQSMQGHADDLLFDGRPYAGYYTQEQIREVVEYARQRCIEVIPEIPMPGHTLAVLAAYPELSCSGGPFETAVAWGDFDEGFCTREPVFQFLQDVLDEVCSLFPAPYIHIGGPAFPAKRWKNCSLCQNRLRSEGLKEEHQLYRWFIGCLARYLEKKGKQIIVTDLMVSDMLPSAVRVMAFKNMETIPMAARHNLPIVLAPDDYCSFDRYQADPDISPLAADGFIPIEKVYEFEPSSFEQVRTNPSQSIQGSRGHVFTEHLLTQAHVQYMVYPRAIALAEVLWSARNDRNFKDFLSRLLVHLPKLNLYQVNYSTDLFNVTARLITDTMKGTCRLALEKLVEGGVIRFTTDGSEPSLDSPEYREPLPLSPMIKARLFINEASGKTLTREFILHKATCLSYNSSPVNHYHGGSVYGLTNGLTGSLQNINNWVGFHGRDMEIVLDLKKMTVVEKISMNFLNKNRSCIYLPLMVEIFSSDDGMDFFPVAQQEVISDDAPRSIINVTFLLPAQSMRYLKVIARTIGTAGAESVCAGEKVWLMADEIVVE
jgi:hexosaminidase